MTGAPEQKEKGKPGRKTGHEDNMTLEEAKRQILPGRYRHFKGKEYEVLDIAQHSETEEPMVVCLPALYPRQPRRTLCGL